MYVMLIISSNVFGLVC